MKSAALSSPTPSPNDPPSSHRASPQTPPVAGCPPEEETCAAAPTNKSTVPSTRAATKKTTKGNAARRGKEAREGVRPTAAASAADGNSPDKKLMHLVIDSGAIIKGAGMTLMAAAENFWTVPEVVTEIRDKKARHHLECLPFELKLREPSDEAMKFAASFARQTGDLRSLSRVDLRVIALTYMLERQETGASHLRTKPNKPGGKVNSKGKGITTSAVAPSTAEGKASPPTTTRGGAPARKSKEKGTKPASKLCSGEEVVGTRAAVYGQDETGSGAGAGAGAGAGEVDALCAAVKKAWTDNVDSAGGGGGKETNGGVVEEEEDRHTASGEEENVEDGSDEGDKEKAEGRDGAHDQQDSHDDVADDDDWEPGRSDVEGEISAAAAPTTLEVNAPFSADDFPSLGGGSCSAAPGANAAASTTATATPSSAEESEAPSAPAAPSASTNSQPSSWSLMARSNPAPFKAQVKADPAPLPAAAAPATSQPTNEGGMFGASGEAAAGDRPHSDGPKVGTSRILGAGAGFGVSGGGAEDDDGEGWINPSNIKSHKAAGLGLNGPSQSLTKGKGASVAASAIASQCRAGCVTMDFAMQNVILQVGLPLLSLDGMAVRRVKQWILRCSACFKTCTEMGRLFCPVCGNAGLDRVSCSVHAKSGATHVHLRKNHKVNLRGSKFSIPAPNPTKGRFEGDLLLREDQLLSGLWAQKARRKEKNISSMFGEDITTNVGLNVSKSADIVVGYGRKNPNSARGRERRGKKAVKKRL